MLKLEQSVPFDRDPNLKRKTDVTNLLADPTKIKQLGWEPTKLLKI
jgi:GDP-D-mannose dehydratase